MRINTDILILEDMIKIYEEGVVDNKKWDLCEKELNNKLNQLSLDLRMSIKRQVDASLLFTKFASFNHSEEVIKILSKEKEKLIKERNKWKN